MSLLPATGSPTTPSVRVANVEQACHQVLSVFAGVYGDRFKPSKITTAAWAWALEGCKPVDIIDACRAHVSDTTTRKDGSRAGSWPATPADILGIIEDWRKQEREQAQHGFGTREG